ncbi:hypothetical protein GGU10DRAFT_371239 [Lentinula aff. detonsa]|uniref:Uncharacterized protein n=1 Tax=Lentinula aff. detonsa TaxID=2804958 RepID=A0AA38NSQ1_9AGAR|nr:hypothetical protein GGU10DRAFT_371239 [Lentinula aff. detonsa]
MKVSGLYAVYRRRGIQQPASWKPYGLPDTSSPFLLHTEGAIRPVAGSSMPWLPGFHESHKVLFVHASVQNLDSPITSAYGLAAAILYQEIGSVLDLVLENHQPSTTDRDATEQLQGLLTDFGNFADLVRESICKFLRSLEEEQEQTIKGLDQFRGKDGLLDHIIGWVDTI